MNRTVAFVSAAFAALVAFASCGDDKGTDVVIPVIRPEEGGEGGSSSDSEVLPPFKVSCKKSVTTASWGSYDAYTVNCIKGFKPSADPVTDKYGGWTIMNLGNQDGYFRVRKAAGRWWLVDPDGNIFLSKGVAVFSPGSSERQKENISSKYGNNTEWARQESAFLKENGFNSLGAWSQVDIVRNLAEPTPYTVILSPMSNYIGYLRGIGAESEGFKAAGWEGYPYDFAMVFDDKFDEYVENYIAGAAKYKTDKYLIGYFIDNEIPWKDYALDRCLQKWPSTHINHQKAQSWLDARKGKSGASLSEADASDRKAFIAYCYGVYLEKVTAALKKVDPNHLFLGDRFNQWNYELANEEMFKMAGKYVDVVSVNHYQKWQPDVQTLRNWESWSGKPCMITEFYTKGLDSGLGNTTGAGWVVPAQKDRGLFYQNFVNELIKSGVCVGWHWFTYMDNDPTNAGSDSSNIDSNKGIVTWDCIRYTDLINNMREINETIYNLARFYDRN
ncbi:MAG: hypothetical protein IJ799_00400 [Bacteroidales bacterium]|nr:hypothetical protein [Bacteroidales bacterium]